MPHPFAWQTRRTGEFNNRQSTPAQSQQRTIARAKEERDQAKRASDLAAAKLMNALLQSVTGEGVDVEDLPPQGSPLRELAELVALSGGFDAMNPFVDQSPAEILGTPAFEEKIKDPEFLTELVSVYDLDSAETQKLLQDAANQYETLNGDSSGPVSQMSDSSSEQYKEYVEANTLYEKFLSEAEQDPRTNLGPMEPFTPNNFLPVMRPNAQRVPRTFNYQQGLNTKGEMPDRGIHAANALRFLRLNARSVGVNYSLQDLRRNLAMAARRERQQYQLGSATSDVDLPGILGDEKVNIWLESRYTFANDRRSGAEADGEEFRIEAGLSYQLAPTVAVGGKARYRSSSAARDNGSVDAEFNGTGGALFVQVLLPGGAVFTPLFAYEETRSDIILRDGNVRVTGEFDTDFVTFGAGLSRQWSWGNREKKQRFFVEPDTSISIVEADRESYIRSDGELVSASEISQGALTFGPTFGADFLDVSEDVKSVVTRLRLSGTWNFETPNDVLLLSGSLVEAQALFASVRGSVDVRFRGGTRGTLSAGYSGIGSEIGRLSVRASIVYPF